MTTSDTIAVEILIRPAGMTYERAMHIALAADARKGGLVVTPEEAATRWKVKRQVLGRPVGERNAKATPGLRAEVRYLALEEGLNDTVISKRLGVPAKTIGRWRAEEGIPVQPITRNYNQDLHESLLKGYREGLTDSQMGERLGLTRQRIGQARIRYGIPVNRAHR